ncbi:hypothetical protein [Neisseria sp.]|uniref:hypothetical protein n=1 Tax=Neisseria sp. TaxID=192066 RepID=UPI0035A11ECC
MKNSLYRWLIILKKPGHQIWVVPAYWAVIAVVLAFIARFFGDMLHDGALPDIRVAKRSTACSR